MSIQLLLVTSNNLFSSNENELSDNKKIAARLYFIYSSLGSILLLQSHNMIHQ
jgi:hypothetical protein